MGSLDVFCLGWVFWFFFLNPCHFFLLNLGWVLLVGLFLFNFFFFIYALSLSRVYFAVYPLHLFQGVFKEIFFSQVLKMTEATSSVLRV